MTVMDSNLSTPLGIILLIIFGMVSIAALLGNGFIIVVNSHRWFQSRKLVPCDLLLIFLSISRFLMQCVTFLTQFIYISSAVDYTCSDIWKEGSLAWMYFTMASLLGTSCISVFYFMKVTTFANPISLWLKSRIDWLAPCMLIISFIAFIIFSVSPVVDFWRMKTSCGLTRNMTANTSHTETPKELVVLYPLQFSFNAINFSICLSATILLIVSLWRHMKNLKKSGIHTKDLSTQAHIKVVKQLMFFLFFYILYFVSIIIAMGDLFKFGTIERLISDIALSLYPSAHSIILIWTNPKLKRACTRILPSRKRSSQASSRK